MPKAFLLYLPLGSDITGVISCCKKYKETDMNWDAIGAIAELLGAIAVLATLSSTSRKLSEYKSVT